MLLQVSAGAFQRLEQQGVPAVLMPAIGGLVTGVLACQYPEVLYQGFGNVNAILQNKSHFAPLLLFQILGVKIFDTSVSKGSGLVGGTYAPSIFMGEISLMPGAAFTTWAHSCSRDCFHCCIWSALVSS